MRRVSTDIRSSGLAVLLSILFVVSALPFTANVSMALPGYWSDLFDDETKIAQKNNVVVSGGDVSLGTTGTEWYRHGVVVDAGSPGSGFYKVLGPSVLKGSDGLYRMWYVGRQSPPSIMERIRYATSPDGKNWDLYGIVLGENVTQEDRVYSPIVIEDGGTYKMWYVGDDFQSPWGSRIFYATSPDGYSWTRQGMVMNLAHEGTYDTVGLNFPCILKEGATYKMWYSGYDGANYRVIHATSPDGQTWTSQGVVMDLGPPDSPDANHVIDITIAKDPQGLYHAWYAGFNATASSQLNATSPDGVTWTKQGITMVGLPGTLEATVGSGSLMISSNSAFALWYIGLDNSSIYRIFLANFSRHGNIVSEPIGPFPNCDWGTLFANKTDQSADVFVLFSVLDGVDWNIISGYENLSATMINLSSIDPVIHPTIRLRADFWDLANDPISTPLLHDWTVTYIDLDYPIFGGLISAVDDQTGGNITLNWAPASDASTPVTYNVYIATTSLGQNFGTPDHSTTSIGMQVTGLTNGVTYFFIVRAQDAVGHEDNNTMERGAMPTTPLDSTPPDFLGLVVATDTGTGGTVDLSWANATDPDTVECNSDPSPPITYNVHYSTTSFGQNFLVPDATTQNTNIQISGLQDGVEYYFIVRARDAVGNEDQNIAERVVRPTTPIDSTPPEFSGLVTASDAGSGGSVELYWATATDTNTVESNSDPSLPITYNIYYSTTSGGQNFLVPDATTQNTSTQIGGLQNGVDRFFVVRAEDAAGNEEQNLVERNATPTTPVDSTPPIFGGLVSAIDLGTDGNLSLTWLDANDPDTIECNSDPTLPITYNIYISSISGGQDFFTPSQTISGTQASLTGLQNGVRYYIVVRAEDAAGNEETNTIEMSAMPTTPTDSIPPSFTGVASATDDMTGGSVTLTWPDATDPDTVESNTDPSIPIMYSVYVSQISGGQDFLSPDRTTLDNEIAITGLQDGVVYYFVVRAIDAAGNEEQNTVEISATPTTPVDTTSPTFVGIVSATDLGTDGDVALSWSAATDPDTVECNADPSLPLSYNIYISTVSGGQDFLTPNQTASGAQASVTGLQNGVTYYFVVRARDAAGNEEQNTIEMSAVPTTPVDTSPPTFEGLNLVVADDGTGDITLTWIPAVDPDDPECNSDPSNPIRYIIYVSESPTVFNFEGPANITNGHQYTFENLERGVTFYFLVRAEDDAGNRETNTVSRSAELAVKEKPFNLFDYLWIILLIVIIVLLAVIALLARRKKEEPVEQAKEEEEGKAEETVEEE